ncbi:MAG TPA: type II secretion system protein GspL [Allosphingosinicella sp.]|nr:type II secretion system protein GspL [Allosphingosinicella sp.]
MPTSATDPGEPTGTLLHFADGGEALLVAGTPPRVALAVPGTDVAIHWLELAGELTPAQAAAAARLMLADASAEPLSGMHVAAGRPEGGLTPVALVPNASMAAWLAGGTDPDLIVPEPLLIAPPEEGFARRGLDYRARAAAFSVEPELGEMLTGGATLREIDDAAFEAGLQDTLADPVINLRQGPFAKRRHWKVDRGATRRIALLAAALAVTSLIAQIALIMRYSFDADRIEAETAALGPGAGAATRPAFGVLAPLLFEAVRGTPNLELTRIEYRSDGGLGATVQVDTPATFAAFRARVEGSGLAVEGGSLQTVGGRPTAEIVVRPA